MSDQSGTYVTGDGRLMNVTEIAEIFRNCVNLAVPSTGKIQKLDENNFSLTCRFSTTDCDNLESIKTWKAYSLKTTLRDNAKERCIESVHCITDPQTFTETLVATSPNGRYLARLKSPTSPGSGDSFGDKKQLLEIWNRSRLLKTIDLNEVEAHGSINTDVVFGSMSWYPFGNDQDKLIYVCQKKRAKFQSFFKQTLPKATSEGSNSASPKGKQLNLGDENLRQEDWGECLNGIEHTLVAMLDVADNFKITTLDIKGRSLAEVRWLNGLRSVCVAYQEEPRRLGLIHCNNRPSSLLVHDWSQSSEAVEVLSIESDTQGYHNPRVDRSGHRFVYLSTLLFGPHYRSVKIHLHDLNTNQDRMLIDKVTKEGDLFIDKLVDDCFTANDSHILFTRFDTLYSHLCLFNLNDSEMTKIEFPTTGLNLLDFKHDVIFATGSEVNATPTLYVAVLNTVEPGKLVAWHQIEECLHLDEIDHYAPLSIVSTDNLNCISGLLVTPNVDLLQKNFCGTSGDKSNLVSDILSLPTLVIIHGGPHAAFALHYMPYIVFFARLGIRVLLINYRGSSGVSEEYTKMLCGRVGEMDVNDCLHVIRTLVQSNVIDPNKLIIQGGSHGGFLAAHLTCQDEFKFTSAIIRNPVIDIATLHSTTDLPDWSYTEGLGHDNFDFTWIPDPEELKRMYECSPIVKVSQSNVPTLILLGNKDRRVNMFQGERWFELLKARGIKTKCKIYADKHDLSRVEVHSDANMTAVLWILENLPTS